MFLSEDEKKLIIEALEKKASGIDWVLKNKKLPERKVNFLTVKHSKFLDIIERLNKSLSDA